MARLVNKQFNSPIGLYSEQNIKEVIERESQILANGAVGINFNNPHVGKPANLQNSAVLRMLEEEEQRQRSGHAPSNGDSRPLRDQIKWPPPEYEHKNLQRSSFKDVVTPGLKRVAWPPPNEGENYTEQSPVHAQGGPQYSSQSPQNHTPAQQQVPHDPSRRQPLKPLDISDGNYQQSAISPVANPLGFRSTTPNKSWAPVHSPVSSPGQPQINKQTSHYQQESTTQYQQSFHTQSYQPAPQAQVYQPPQYNQSPQYNQPQYNQSPQYNQTPTQQHQPRQQPPQQSVQSVAATNQGVYQQPQTVTRPVEPPPATITLRPQAPVSQLPPPVVTSQPATATLKGGKHLRGDMKWPPENVKRQVEEENRLRIELAKGPAFRPRLVRKDYGPFFAQHALNASYPGYKPPPGTQFYDHKAVY